MSDFSSIRYYVNVTAGGFADIYPDAYGVCEIERIDYSRILVRFTDERNLRIWRGDFYLGNTPVWKGWILQATAEPPTWYNLPLASGITASTANPAQYCKDQFGCVHLRGRIVGLQNGNIFATIPAGFRAAYHMQFLAAQSAGIDNAASVRIGVFTSGEMHVEACSSPQTLSAWSDISYSYFVGP